MSVGFFYSQAMEKLPLQESVKRKFLIENRYPARVKVLYLLRISEGAPLKEESLLVEKDERKEVPDWQKIVKLVVGPYGEWKEMATREILNMNPTDYQLELHKQAGLYKGDLVMQIKPGAQRTPEMLAFAEPVLAYAKPVLGRIAPYDVTILPSIVEQKQEIEIPESRLIKDALKRVKEAVESGEKILPRYVLGVAPGASLDALSNAHQQLLAKWQPQMKSDNARDIEFRKNLIEYIDSAYDVLKAEAKFEALNEKHFK